LWGNRRAVNARPVACPILVGRDRELAVLSDAKRGLSKSHPAFVLLGGDAGIGKSRLLDQFLRNVANERTRNVASVECLEYAPAPFGPIRQVLDQLARTARLALPPPLAQFVARDVASETFEKADLFLAVVDFFRKCANQRATIVTIEDLHWADAMTLEFLSFAASRLAGSRLLIIVTYRSNETEHYETLRAAIARLIREPITFRIELEGLAKAELRALILGALDGQEQLTAHLIENVALRAEGNPFFAEELLKDTLGRRGPRASGALPTSIRASIVERLRGFAPNERAIIDRAAVLGLRFDPHVLARTMETDVDAILPALRKARDANLIVEEDSDRVRFRFRHALTRQAVYDELLLFDARRTHRSILEALESLEAGSEHLEELAYHAWEAREPEKTLRYNERAADAALVLQALPEAQLGYERALGAASDRTDEARLLERLGRVMSLLGELPRAIETYDAACAAAIEIGDFDAAARVTRWSAADRNNSGDASSVAFGMAFLERWGDRVSVAVRDELFALLARLCIISYDTELATTLLGRIAALEELPPTALQNVLIVRFEIAWITGDISAWTAAAMRLLELLPSLPAFIGLTVCYAIAHGASYQARDDLVARAFAHADRLEARTDFGGLRGYGASIRALDLFSRGKLAAARDSICAALGMPDVRVATAVLALLAPFVADALDDDTLVTPEIEAEFATIRVHAKHADDGVILAGAALWARRTARNSQALADIRQALSCLSHPIVHVAAVVVLAARYLPVAELTLLSRFVDPDACATDDDLGRAHALAAGSIVAGRRDDQAAAFALGTAAADIYRRLGRPLHEAQALESAGQIGAARARYERCGAKGWAKRLIDPAQTARPADYALSNREREVARLIADGLGNAAIAERLSIATKTVEKHVGSIYDKLGVRSRPQVALLVSRAG
jgi:DNA-binding CsgD family transcriptional regulator